MSLQSNASAGKVNFASEYNVDKICGVYVGSFNAATQTTPIAGYIYQFPISHSFTRPVFCELLWSTDGTNYVDGGAGNGPTGASGISYSDSSNIYVTTSLNAGTIYYKVICSWIDNYDTTNPLVTPVLQTNNNAYFDSRQSYQKIFLQDKLTATTVNSDNLLSVTHGLGYNPNAKIYFESITGQVWPQIYGGTIDFWLYDSAHQSECYAIITTTKLNIDCLIPASGHSTRIWYRIYLDK